MYEHASFGRRFVALLIDELIFLPFTILLEALKPSHNLSYTFLGTTLNLLIALAWFFYNIFFVWKSGSTIGKKLLKLRVVNLNYQRVSLGQAILRETLGKLISGILQLGYLWVLIDKKRQGFHDKIAKTFVVQLDLNKNLIPAENFGVPKLSKVAFFLLFFFFGLPIGFVILLTLVYLFVGSPAKISGNSMYPNYTQGQYYMTNKLVYLFGNPRREDVVILRSPLNPTQQLIKRVIGLPGDQVSTKDGRVYINGQPLSESYLPAGTYTGDFLQEGTNLTIPQNQYFVLGDNRERSIDSRTFLLLPRENILAKVSFCYWACNTHILASSPISQPSPTFDPTANWQIYINSKYKFFLRYPQYWKYLDVPNATYQTDEGIWFLPQSVPMPGPNTDASPPVSIRLSSRDLSINPQTVDNYRIESYTNGILQGNKITGTSKAGLPVNEIDIRINNLYIQAQAQDQYRSFLDQILSTFKFTDQTVDTSNWPTFTDSKNQLSFKYPTTWRRNPALPDSLVTSSMEVGGANLSMVPISPSFKTPEEAINYDGEDKTGKQEKITVSSEAATKVTGVMGINISFIDVFIPHGGKVYEIHLDTTSQDHLLQYSTELNQMLDTLKFNQ